MSRYSLLISLLLALTSLPLPSDAKELTFAVHPAPPFIIPGDDFNADASKGIDIDIIKEISQNLGIKLKLKYCAWHACLKKMKHGNIDILSFANKRTERESYLHYLSHPYLTENPTAVYTRIEDPRSINRYEDLLLLPRVGLLRYAAHYPRLDQDQEIKKVYVNSAEQLFPMLALGRLDAIIVAQRVADYRIKVNGFDDSLKLAYHLPSGHQPLYITLSKKNISKALFQAFDKEHSRLLENGRIAEIITLHTQP